MIKKRAILYFLIIGFPMGLGAGASSWLKLPTITLPRAATIAEVETAPEPIAEIEPKQVPAWYESEIALPNFSALHPLVVGSFSLLVCTGILLVADEPKRL